jgi:hypothetical protein
VNVLIFVPKQFITELRFSAMVGEEPEVELALA